MYFPDEARAFIQISVSENIDECCLKLRIDVLPNILKQDLQRKKRFYLFGTDIVPIVCHIGKVIDLGGKSLTFSREDLRKLLHFVSLSIVVYIKLPIQRLNRQN